MAPPPRYRRDRRALVEAAVVEVIEFEGQAPRGAECSADSRRSASPAVRRSMS